MEPARFLILAEYPDGPMLYRYSADWQFAGDTWHANLEDLHHNLGFEFGVTDLTWTDITDDEFTTLLQRS